MIVQSLAVIAVEVEAYPAPTATCPATRNSAPASGFPSIGTTLPQRPYPPTAVLVGSTWMPCGLLHTVQNIRAVGMIAGRPIKKLSFLPNIRIVVSFANWRAARQCGPCKCAPVCLQSHLPQRKNSRFSVVSPPLSIGAGLRRPGEVAPLPEAYFCHSAFLLDEAACPCAESMSSL